MMMKRDTQKEFEFSLSLLMLEMEAVPTFRYPFKSYACVQVLLGKLPAVRNGVSREGGNDGVAKEY